MSPLSVALIAALSGGIVDAIVALLKRPNGLERVSDLSLSVLAASAALLLTYAAVWPLLRPVVRRLHASESSAALALAVLIAGGFTASLLAGLHLPDLWSHAVVRAALVCLLAAIMGGGAYALAEAVASHEAVQHRLRPVLIALPVLLSEVLCFEWVGVYAVDAGGTRLLTGVLTVMLAATALALYRLRRPIIAYRALAALVAVLVVAPIASSAYSSSSTAPAATSSPRAPKQIILITVDTLRADAVSAYASGAKRTAAIDGLAADGVLFEEAIAPAPWTLPSLASLLSGLSPSVHQVTGFQSRLPDRAVTLAELLQRRGYLTAAIVHNDLLGPPSNLAQGFLDYTSLHERWWGDSVGATLLQRVWPARFRPQSWPTTSDHTNLVVDWLERHRDEAFFLWVHYLDPHAPYAPPREFVDGTPPPAIGYEFEGQKMAMEGFVVTPAAQRPWVRALYDDEVRYVDTSIGRVIDTLKRLGLYNDALITLTSDHGEEFWEHGMIGHGHSQYRELLRVPLVVKAPGGRRGARAPARVTTVSIMPTLLDLAGVAFKRDELSAPSLASLIVSTGAPFEEQPILSTAQMVFDRRDALTFGDYTYIASQIDGREELFRQSDDPKQQRSLSGTPSAPLDEARRLMAEQRTRAAQLAKRLRINEEVTPTDSDTIRRLRSLGYVR